jgi:DNA-binding CsgD family transcriptional regulator
LPLPLLPDLLLERERELEAISALLAGARASEGAAVIVEGAAGIGKSELLDHARREASGAGLEVLTASGGELETDFPFGIVSQLFEPAVRRLSPHERGEVLAGAAGLSAPVVAGAPAPAPTGDDRSAAMSHGLYWLASNLADRAPLLLAVDDVQWADVSSLRFLLFLTRRLAGLPVAVMSCVRSGASVPGEPALGQLTAEPGIVVLRPAGLSARAVARMIEAGLGSAPDQAFVDACVTATGGTPFLIEELIATLAADGVRPSAQSAAGVGEVGPATIARATVRQITRLPTGAMAVARAVAVLGASADAMRVARLAGLPSAVASAAADALAAVNILRLGSPLRFVHPILRSAVYEDLLPGERSAAHARVADLLTEEGADHDAVAGHLMLTAPAGEAAVTERLRIAAARALARGAPENAEAYLRRALAEQPGSAVRAELLPELAAATRLTNPPQAIEVLREAIALRSDDASRGRLAAELVQQLVFLGRWEEGVAILDATLRDLAGRDRELSVLLESMALGYSAYDPRLTARFRDIEPRMRAAIADGVVTARGPALLLAATTVMGGGDRSDALALLAFGLDGGGLVRLQESFALIPQAFLPLIFLDELDRAAGLSDELLRTVRSVGSMGGFLITEAHRAVIETRRGDLRHAEGELRAAADGMQQSGLLFGLPSLLWYAADAIVERSELDDLARLALGLELPADLAATFTGAILREVRGRLRALAGDSAAAVGDLRAAWAITDALGFVNPNFSSVRCELALQLAAVDPDEARALTESALHDARHAGLPRAIGVCLRTLGILGGGERGRDRLSEAVDTLRDSPARLELARALVELGAALRRANRRSDAREPLGEGLALAHRCGATRLAERARTELLAAGARPRRAARSGADALTPSELRVAEMAADGMSNPQIGQALFVTRNTVETHLRHIYRKLDIRSRQDLASALGSGGQKITEAP